MVLKQMNKTIKTRRKTTFDILYPYELISNVSFHGWLNKYITFPFDSIFPFWITLISNDNEQMEQKMLAYKFRQIYTTFGNECWMKRIHSDGEQHRWWKSNLNPLECSQHKYMFTYNKITAIFSKHHRNIEITNFFVYVKTLKRLRRMKILKGHGQLFMCF